MIAIPNISLASPAQTWDTFAMATVTGRLLELAPEQTRARTVLSYDRHGDIVELQVTNRTDLASAPRRGPRSR